MSNVIDMKHMFEYSEFTGDVSRWDVSRVYEFYHIFSNCKIPYEHIPERFKKVKYEYDDNDY